MISLFVRKYKNIKVPEFKELKKQRNTVILDVRARAEQLSGVINGQRNLNIMDKKKFKDQVSKLDREKTYLLYCRSGMRSAKACRIMGKMGFKHLYNLKGGYNAWERENL